jgi:hypothetical protein
MPGVNYLQTDLGENTFRAKFSDYTNNCSCITSNKSISLLGNHKCGLD